MKRTLAVIGAGALLAWTGLGLVAWSNVARHMTVVLSDRTEPPPDPELLALSDQVSLLHSDLQALAAATNQNLQALHDELLASEEERAAAVERSVAALRDEAGSLPPSPPDELAGLAEPRELRHDIHLAHADSASQLVPSSAPEQPSGNGVTARLETAATPEPAPAAKPRRSFLAFQLPSDDFRFDERRTWAVVPSLSRVGFDAKTTLHDFTGVTSAVEGEITVDLALPAQDPRVALRVEATALKTGDEDRDQAMLEHLAVSEHPAFEFVLTSFEPSSVDAGARKVAGVAHGRMTIRSVTRDVAMTVALSIDDAQRLCVEGAMTLDLEHYRVPVPSKLGLIAMEKDVEVWISLRLRVNPRTDG